MNRIFQVVIVDGLGSTTQTIRGANDMEGAISIAIRNRPYTNMGVRSVTATTLQ